MLNYRTYIVSEGNDQSLRVQFAPDNTLKIVRDSFIHGKKILVMREKEARELLAILGTEFDKLDGV